MAIQEQRVVYVDSALGNKRAQQYRRFKSTMTAVLLLTPALVFLAAFVYIPSAMSLWISFFHYHLMGVKTTWAGLTNFQDALHLGVFQIALRNTLYFAVMLVPSTLALSIAIALLVDRATRFYNVIRTLILLPYATPAVGTAIGWLWILDPNYGIANSFLKMVGLPTSGWLQSPVTALPSVVIYSLWHGLGFNVVIVLSALSNLPRGVLEAATVDGASGWRRFWTITLPLLSPTLFFLTIVTTIDTLQSFAQVFALSGGTGGPEYSTMTLLLLIYQTAMKYNDFSFAAAMAIILVIIILAFTLVQRWAGKRMVFYQ